MSPQDAAAAVTQVQGPVVLIDTCSLLDMVRARDEFRADHARAATALLELAEARRLTIVLPQQVISEYNAHLDAIRQSAVKAVDDASARVKQMAGIMRAYGEEIELGHQPRGEIFATAAGRMLERLLAIAVVSDHTQDITNNALTRSLAGLAPAGPGKEALKDCIVLETCLDTIDRVRGRGHQHSAHFLSANIREYGEPTTNRRTLHLQLEPEFNRLAMDYATNFLELRYCESIDALVQG